MKLDVAMIRSAVNAPPLVDAESAVGVIESAYIDSRSCQQGSLFVAIIAERDGHNYIDAARQLGAVAWLTQHPDSRVGAIVVPDTRAALAAIGRLVRTKIDCPVIGITGSSGKTSTKDLLAAIVLDAGPSGYSEKSFNNELGVPLTLINSPDSPAAVVIEMGARGIGHIALLCEVAHPNVGVVTNVGTAHGAMYDRPDGILVAKGELVAALPANGVAVLNFDDPSAKVHGALTSARVLTFSAPIIDVPASPQADVTVRNVSIDPELRASFDLNTPWGSTHIRLRARGRHQAANAAAAAAAALASGFSLENVQVGLSTESLSPWRMEMKRADSGAVILNDAYNANDQSMAAALRSLKDIPAKRRIAVLGTMAELGGGSHNAHRAMVTLAADLGIDILVSVHEEMYEGAQHHVDDLVEAMDVLSQLSLGPGDAVLIKASRVAGLERLASDLLRVKK